MRLYLKVPHSHFKSTITYMYVLISINYFYKRKSLVSPNTVYYCVCVCIITEELDQQWMGVFPQVFQVDLQVGQKEFNFPFVLGLQKEAFVISRSPRIESK